MDSEQFIENLLTVLPYWQHKLVKPIRQALKSDMGLESYYTLQTLRQFGPMSMTDLAFRLKITKQRATKIINGLYENGLVGRQADTEDRRFIYIGITDSGTAYLYSIFREDGLFFERLEEKIGQEELAALQQAIDTLLRILPRLD